ncbi:MAG TPA: methionine--tRNA ligase [Nitrososphaeraceae archaeon]|nr:methionine--tRNA ligase [Nitrososphaeraceae archaeon]
MNNDLTDNEDGCISFQEFLKIDLRVGKIKKIETVPRMNKIYKAEIDIGTENRDVVIGVAEHYKPEQLERKIVVVCINLRPKKMGQIFFRGMVLAAECDKEKPVLITIDSTENCSIGSKIH